MKKLFSLAILVNLSISSWGACPPSYDEILGKCYSFLRGSPQVRDVADGSCLTSNGHLWIVDSEEEFNVVTSYYGLDRSNEAGSAPNFWTDAVVFRGEPVWASNGAPVTILPEMGKRDQCCSGTGCEGATYETGDCLTIGTYTETVGNSGLAYLPCHCHEKSPQLPPLCELEGPFVCPGDGVHPVGECGNHYWNCEDNVATLAACGLELRFSKDSKTCEKPEDVPGCD